MEKQFVTITAGNHPDWTAQDWKDAWADILKKIDTTKDDVFISSNVEFVDWKMWMGVDPAYEGQPYPLGALAQVYLIEKRERLERDHVYGKHDNMSDCPICEDKQKHFVLIEATNKRLKKKLRSYGFSEENFIVKNGKVYMNNPMLDTIIMVKP